MGNGDPVGKNFRFIGRKGTIVGVLKNFCFQAADQSIQPMAFTLSDTSFLYIMLIRLTPGKVPESLHALEKTWKNVIPDYPLEYNFIDQDYDNLYRAENRLTGLLKYFTILAVIIACLGLYGLSSYSADRRTNEIGIRKVMGAGSGNVIFALSKEFLLLILISIIIALPISYIIVGNFLKQYSNRIAMSPLVFVGIAGGAILIAMLTISFQAFKATGINPAEALKVK
jgi:ABC-type antimicrobial peptide transport system permease subunit